MPVAAGISAVGALGSAALGFFGSQSATNKQLDFQRQALAAQQAQWQTAWGALSPYAAAGQSVLPTLTNLLTPGPNQTRALSMLPGFQFAQDWGQMAARNQGTTMGLGGNVLYAGEKTATGLAQQGFGGLVNALQSFANTGASAAGNIASAAGTAGGQIGGTLGTMGSTAGAGILGGFNALGQGIQGVGNALALPYILNRFGGQGTPGTPTPSVPGQPLNLAPDPGVYGDPGTGAIGGPVNW